MVVTRGKGGGRGGRREEMVMEGDLTLGGKHTIQYTDDVLLNCTLETSVMLLTYVTPIHLIKLKKN